MKENLLIIIPLVVFAYGTMIGCLGYIIKLHLKPLQGIPEELRRLIAKVKSEEELQRMIREQILNHEVNCPLRELKK